MNRHVLSTLARSFLLISILSSLAPIDSPAQQIGKHAEMERLEQQADDLAAQADPEGAALAIGKAAMMAEILSADSREHTEERVLQAASYLFRAQEQSLRALSLFELAGGTPPASTGVCQYLVQGNQKLHHSKELLENSTAFARTEIRIRRDHLLDKTQEWENLLQGLHEDFACPDLLIRR